MKKLIGLISAVFALIPVAVAQPSVAQTSYEVVEPGVRIAYPESISSWDYVGPDTLLVRASNGLHIVRVNEGCTRNLSPGYSLGVVAGDNGLDSFSRVVIDDRRCRVISVDKVRRTEAQG
jgi:hypothetical protein